jgi:adenylate kinase family enzyme
MRIGVSGSAGTGKTTLCKALAEYLGVPFIPDTTEEALAEHGKKSWRGIMDTRVRRQIRLDALDRKIKAETAADDFVSEKSVVDYLAYWLQNQAEFETKEQNQAVVDMVRAHLPRYTHRLFLPYRSEIDYAEGRNQDPVHNLKVAANIFGMYAVMGHPAIETPHTFGEDIAEWATRFLARKKEEGGARARLKARRRAKAPDED